MGDWAGQSLRADRSCWWLEGGNEPPGELNCLEEAGADRLEMVVALGGGHPPGVQKLGSAGMDWARNKMPDLRLSSWSDGGAIYQPG